MLSPKAVSGDYACPAVPRVGCRPWMSREPTLEVGRCLLTRHRPQVRRVTHTHTVLGERLV
eukprot:5957229-Prymnesium_polylepis.1